MINSASKLRHVNEITEYDFEHHEFYLRLFDMKKAGMSWEEIANTLWHTDKPEHYKKHLKEHYKRAKWMTLTGFKLLIRDNPLSKSESLDALVKQGHMKPEERDFLESEAGAKFWPKKTRH